ncbi:hypothetical protein [Pseudonocardia sp. HH130629-09]|uniref:hypothetical protein n=1 Tax=Pseudonocardia sp. HH130629-09 TaxID=1641402 RepID=UPI0006CB6F24|nr:hypothetical protein [Pseudonocardia sp. HH130629-09]ALE85753.1 hypothetical protein XF36_23545 [Pseudonocardia sp. HH130629-09]
MKNRMRRSLIALGALGAVAFPLAGIAAADDDREHGYPSSQSPTQGLDAVGATVDTFGASFLDASDTFSPDDRPDGVNGTDTEFPQADPRFVEGPAGGLVTDGPFE